MGKEGGRWGRWSAEGQGRGSTGKRGRERREVVRRGEKLGNVERGERLEKNHGPPSLLSPRPLTHLVSGTLQYLYYALLGAGVGSGERE